MQINPQLDPKKNSAWQSAKPPQPPPAPADVLIPSFFPRLAALAIDLAALWGIAMLIDRALRVPLLGIGAGAPILASAILFGWFSVSASPLTRGQSVGKRVLRLRTVGLDGAPRDWAFALLRGAVQTAPLVLWTLIALWRRSLGPAVGIGFVEAVLPGVLLGFLAADAICGIFSPLSRALHDLAGGTVVIRDNVSRAEAGKLIAVRLPALPRMAPWKLAIVFLPMTALVGVSVWSFTALRKPWMEEDRARRYETIGAVPELKGMWMRVRPSAAPAATTGTGGAATGADAPTSGTFRLVLEFASYGRIGEERVAAIESNREAILDTVKRWCVDYGFDYPMQAFPLGAGDIRDWKAFASGLQDRGVANDPTPAKRIWGLLDDATKEAIVSLRTQPGEKSRQEAAIKGINAALGKKDFYDPAFFSLPLEPVLASRLAEMNPDWPPLVVQGMHRRLIEPYFAETVFSGAERMQAATPGPKFTAAALRLQFTEVLDLIVPFSGEPRIKWDSPFTADQLHRMGIRPAPGKIKAADGVTSSTLKAVDPITTGTVAAP